MSVEFQKESTRVSPVATEFPSHFYLQGLAGGARRAVGAAGFRGPVVSRALWVGAAAAESRVFSSKKNIKFHIDFIRALRLCAKMISCRRRGKN